MFLPFVFADTPFACSCVLQRKKGKKKEDKKKGGASTEGKGKQVGSWMHDGRGDGPRTRYSVELTFHFTLR